MGARVGARPLGGGARPPRGVARARLAQPADGRRDAVLDARSAPRQPSSSRAFSTDGQRRCTSTSNVGRCSSANSLRRPRRRPPRRCARSRRRVSSREAEMLKSSFSPAGEPIAVTIPSAMSSTWVSVRVCSPEPKISQRALAGEHLVDQVGHARARCPARLGGHLAGAVGVEGPADRVGQPVLGVRRAAVDLAGELRERRSADSGTGQLGQVVLRRREHARRARTPSRRTRTRSAPPRGRARRG